MSSKSVSPSNGSTPLAEPNVNGHIWTREQMTFMLWLALPRDVRTPASQKDLAEKFGVTAHILSDWKHIPGFADEVVKLVRELVKTDDLANVLAAMVEEATENGNVQAARLVLETTGLMEGGGAGGDKRVQIIIINADGKNDKEKEGLLEQSTSIFDD